MSHVRQLQLEWAFDVSSAFVNKFFAPLLVLESVMHL